MNGSSTNDRPGRYSQTMDPGEIENRLSLNPSNPDWKDFLGNWSDGEEYTLKDVKVRQISPGEFEVTAVTPQDAPAEEAGEQPGATDEAEAGATGTDENGYKPGMNPAVMKMMNGPKS